MTEIQPAFVDGPLKGSAHSVPPDCVRRGVLMWRETGGDLGVSFRDLTYTIRHLGLWGRAIAYWSCAEGDADPSDLFDVLISPAGHAAVVATVPRSGAG